MAIRWGEVAGPLLTFLVLVALPLGAIKLIPADTLSQLENSDLNIQGLAIQTAMLGFVVSTLALAKAVITKTSVAYLILNVSSNIVSFAFALLVVGVGNIGSLGFSSFKLAQSKLSVSLARMVERLADVREVAVLFGDIDSELPRARTVLSDLDAEQNEMLKVLDLARFRTA